MCRPDTPSKVTSTSKPFPDRPLHQPVSERGVVLDHQQTHLVLPVDEVIYSSSAVDHNLGFTAIIHAGLRSGLTCDGAASTDVIIGDTRQRSTRRFGDR